MVKKRTKTPWMDADTFGRSIPRGLGINLLVTDVSRAARFQRAVFGVETVYEDVDFCVQTGFGSQWMLHADHTYLDHPLSGILAGAETRGAGIELRLYGCDPDKAEAMARTFGAVVLDGTIDKPHGLRECVVLDDDGYAWVPCVSRTNRTVRFM
jgi:catechol 2,3-dioxygenase-like lactoylglutathione lyase family enzyme